MFLLYSFLFFIFRTSAEFLLRRAGYLCPRPPQLCDTSLLCQTRIGRSSLNSDSLNFNTRDQAGATVPTGPQWVLGHSGHCTPPQATAGWGTGGLGYRSTAQLPYSSHLHPPRPPALAGAGLGLGSQLQTRLKGERWVSGGAGGRREERG